jgi:hypothetical protein
MKDALIQLGKAVQTGPCANLVPVLFGERTPMRSKDAMKFSPFNKNLDDSQVTIFSFVDCIQLLLVDAASMSSIYVLTHMVG